MKPMHTFFIVLALAVLLVFGMTVYTVQEGHQALLLRLGKVETNSQGKAVIEDPGLHFKWPVINKAAQFDMRLQTMDKIHLQIVTAEKKDVIVDYYAKWRIANVPLFFRRTNGNYAQANLLLEQRLNDSLKAEFGQRDIKEVVSEDRVSIMKTVQASAEKETEELGIHVVDVRIKRIDLPDAVSDAVFDRMRAERSRVAKEHLAKGRAKAEEIRANADAQAEVIRATAGSQAQHIRADGDAEAAKIYADAYGKNPSFYAFYRSLEAYKKTFQSKRDFLVLRPDSQFFEYFNNAKGSPAK